MENDNKNKDLKTNSGEQANMLPNDSKSNLDIQNTLSKGGKFGQRNVRDTGDRRKNIRSSRREGRIKPEFDQKIINIRRVTRVVAGGKRFNFSVALVAGNKKGSVGVGLGKGADTALAIDKAMRDAKKHMINVKVTKTMSIPHEVYAKYSSARVKLIPAPGRGIIAGSSVRAVLELGGLKDIVGKLFSGTKNTTNNAQAAIKALGYLSLPREKVETNTFSNNLEVNSENK